MTVKELQLALKEHDPDMKILCFMDNGSSGYAFLDIDNVYDVVEDDDYRTLIFKISVGLHDDS